MLQQTQAARVVPHYERFLARFPVPAALAAAPAGAALAAWTGLGYNRRALALRAAAEVIARDGWPRPLTALPGVGPYTAAAVASFAWDEQVAAVDTNVRRVVGRWEATAHAPRALAERAAALLPRGRAADWNQAMMELGATVCTARRPACARCPVAGWCAGAGEAARGGERAGRGDTMRAGRADAARAGGAGRAEAGRADAARPRFEDTDRWARGRVVAALVAGEPLPAALTGERRERVLAGLERDGLIRRDADGALRLP